MSSTLETPDLSTLSHADLLQRVIGLEARLARLNVLHTSVDTATSSKKRVKKPKTFDPSKYNTRLIALKFAYLGGNYNGFEHHANNITPLPTIEEELWKALRKTRLILPTFRDGQDESEVCWDGCDYSKCGRTDRGVSAFGQVVVLRVRSSRPKLKAKSLFEDGEAGSDSSTMNGNHTDEHTSSMSQVATQDSELVPANVVPWDSAEDELPYIQLLNRVLPQEIRILAWCPAPSPDFSARFDCKQRQYRYFFSNPAYAGGERSTLKHAGEGHLDIDAMKRAANKFEGLHDFRNFCKVDPSKQISNFERRIFHSDIHAVDPQSSHVTVSPNGSSRSVPRLSQPQMYFFDVRGSAFLWHQVRHLVAILFLVGQGYEDASIVDKLLDVHNTPSRPMYDMASDAPLVLWECAFPSKERAASVHHEDDHSGKGYEDALQWIYAGSESGGRDTSKRALPGVEDGKYGRSGVIDELWALWRRRKIDELLAGSLLDLVAGPTGGRLTGADLEHDRSSSATGNLGESSRVFDGSDRPRTVGKYVPITQRERTEPPAVVNARYAVRKGLTGSHPSCSDVVMGD